MVLQVIYSEQCLTKYITEDAMQVQYEILNIKRCH